MILDFVILTCQFGLGMILVNVLDLIMSKERRVKRNVIFLIIELLVLAGYLFTALPSKNLSSVLWINIIGAVAASLLLLPAGFLGGSGGSSAFLNFGKRKDVSKKAKKPRPKSWATRLFGLSLLAVALLFVISSVTAITSIDQVYKTIPIKTEEKAEALSSTKETPIAIAPETAKRKMLQKFSVIPNSNMFTLDGITAQMVNGEYVYVATVEFNGFFKWMKLKDIPGYFIISATDINAQPKFVEKEFAYAPSAYIMKDAARRIYAAFPGYASTGTINLEIDENENPYYIQTLYKEYGVSGKMHYDEFKTAVLNAATGEVKLYDSKKAPKFIDAPITSAAANSMNEYFGQYSQGWWNQTSFGSKKDVKQPTDNGIYASGQITPMMNMDGQLNYFTDFTSGDDDQDSALGYSLINARTGEMTYYRDTKAGIMDSDGAISIASKIYPEKKWKASMPVLYNIDGIPTWIVSLMDSKGIFKEYVYINAIDNDIVVDADAAQAALDAYRIELSTKGSNNESSKAATLKELSGTIDRVSIVATGSQTVVSFLLEDQPTIYSVTTNNSPMAQFLQKGDAVHFKAAVTADTKAASIEDLEIEGLDLNGDDKKTDDSTADGGTADSGTDDSTTAGSSEE